LSTTPDRLETATEDYRHWNAALYAALGDTGDVLDRSPADPARAWVAVEADLRATANSDQMAKLLAVALVWLAGRDNSVRRA
jgi:hypothetical protein